MDEDTQTKPFLTANIDRAIVMTQYDLRSFQHPLGMRVPQCPKYLAAATANLVAFAANSGRKKPGKITDPQYVRYWDGSYADYLAMCRRLAKCCDLSEKEAIQLIVVDIVRQSEAMKAEVAAGKRESSDYLQPLERENPDNMWGRAVLALAEAFEVKEVLALAGTDRAESKPVAA